MFPVRMLAVIPSTRNRSDVGRFPTVTFGFEEEAEEKEEPEETNERKENACQQWLFKACNCCYRQQREDGVAVSLRLESGMYL